MIEEWVEARDRQLFHDSAGRHCESLGITDLVASNCSRETCTLARERVRTLCWCNFEYGLQSIVMFRMKHALGPYWRNSRKTLGGINGVAKIVAKPTRLSFRLADAEFALLLVLFFQEGKDF